MNSPATYSKLVNVYANNIETIYPDFDIFNTNDSNLNRHWGRGSEILDLEQFLIKIGEDKEVTIHLSTNLGNWLSQHNFGRNAYDHEKYLYLWTFPAVVLNAMVLWSKSDFAGLSLVEYITGVCNEDAGH